MFSLDVLKVETVAQESYLAGPNVGEGSVNRKASHQ